MAWIMLYNIQIMWKISCQDYSPCTQISHGLDQFVTSFCQFWPVLNQLQFELIKTFFCFVLKNQTDID